MTDHEHVLIEPSGCRHCGRPQQLENGYPHAQRWDQGAGWHGWTPPTQEQIKARMLARRTARTGKRS